jgi:hypothetical protein
MGVTPKARSHSSGPRSLSPRIDRAIRLDCIPRFIDLLSQDNVAFGPSEPALDVWRSSESAPVGGLFSI